MKSEDFFEVLGNLDDDIVKGAKAPMKKKGSWLKWGASAACFGLILTVALVTLPGVLKGSGNVVPPSGSDVPGPVEPGTIQSEDTRAEVWRTAEELGMAKLEGAVVGGFNVPVFISYQGGFYSLVDTEQMDSLRFAPFEGGKLLFNTDYTHNVYMVEDHPDWVAIHINGMDVYEKIFDVIFDVDGASYAIAYSPVMNADYGLGDVVLETEDYTVYEAVKLQGEPAQTTEYIVDILPLLQRERPNFFDGSELEPGDSYTDQWQLALPLE